jgi:CBS domain-containing protein
MENTIAQRIKDFMKDYPPFNLIDKKDLKWLAERVVVKYFTPGQTVFNQGDDPGQYIYMVREGAVHLYRQEGEKQILLDECDEGDVFGIRPLLAKEPYATTAKAEEESIVYAIHIGGFEKFAEVNPRIMMYLARTFAASARSKYDGQVKGKLFLHNDQLVDSNFPLLEVQSIETKKAPITCGPNATVQQAALIMTDNEVGSIIVTNESKKPLGIITDRDLRKKIATGIVPLETPVSEIMSSPVVTVSPNMTVADVQILMIRHKIHHLCITEDGTSNTPAAGVISEHDLLVIQANNPAILIREIKRSNSGEQIRGLREKAEVLLKKYIYQEVSILFISTIMSEINDSIIVRAIEMSITDMEREGYKKPEADFCWLGLGSEGRREQLLRTDQDNALIFEDVAEEDYKSTKAYYLELSGRVTRILNEAGFKFCPADMMASNPKWCLSLQEWKETFEAWIFQPVPKALMHSTIFFDYRPIYGKIELSDALSESIFEYLNRQTIFLSFLAKNAMENPAPLSFFRNFVVERSGEHKNEFDIKARAMMPLADAARVLTLSHRVSKVNNTVRRFQKMAELEPQNKELYIQAADAYETLMRYRALQGLKNLNSGRFFNPSELNKMERLNLRNSFQPIDELQSLLNLRFQLAYLR